MLVPAFNHLGDLLKGFAPRSLLLRTRVFTLCFRGSPSGLLPLSLPDPAQVCIIQVEVDGLGSNARNGGVLYGTKWYCSNRGESTSQTDSRSNIDWYCDGAPKNTRT